MPPPAAEELFPGARAHAREDFEAEEGYAGEEEAQVGCGSLSFVCHWQDAAGLYKKEGYAGEEAQVG